ncbi:hypothetical protein JCM10908_007332 [Rhodotorula pacifica]|uniref:uncharacterized protein n=1 Tax=Rhodotorula pacifica TaxID=1495444 RepID=UPI003180B677
MLVCFPIVPAGEDPYVVYLRYLDETFNPPLSVGFVPRLAVLWALTGYGIAVSCAYMIVHIADCRRKKKPIWLWRLVRRTNGRYIVGNQHLLFAAMSLVTCSLSIGLTLSFYQVFVNRTHQRDAFFWRSIIWIPVGAHMWLSSYANLQASILATQEAAGRHLLSPLIANGLYLSGFAGFFFSVLADGALYAFCSLLVIGANLGGMALILTLRRQIRFNLNRIPSSDPTVALPVLLHDACAVVSADVPFGTALPVNGDRSTPCPLPVLCSRVIETQYEGDAPPAPNHAIRKGASVTELKRIAADGPHRHSAYRTQAKQILALKKIETDVWIFLAAVIALATACLAVGLWLLCSPRMIFGRLSRMEIAYFFVIWMYFIGTDVALTFLLINYASVSSPRREGLQSAPHVAKVSTFRAPQAHNKPFLPMTQPALEDYRDADRTTATSAEECKVVPSL